MRFRKSWYWRFGYEHYTTALEDFLFSWLGASVVLIAVLLILLGQAARAEEIRCPQPPGTTCKVITLTPQEEQALTAPNAILDSAAAARKLDLSDVVNYFKNKIAAAPAGEVVEPPKPPAPATPPADDMPAKNSKPGVDSRK